MVAGLGDVGQMAEIGEGADHTGGLRPAQAFEQLLELAVGLVIGIAPEGHRELADLLDQLVGFGALLRTDHIPQNAPQQANVLDQRSFGVFAGWLGGGGVLHGRRG